MSQKLISTVCFLLLTCKVAIASSEFELTEVASGLGIPWGMAFIAGQELLISEKSGKLKILNLVDNKVRNVGVVADVVDRGQGGLLDVAASPNYGNDGWLYFTYSKKVTAGAATTLARAKLMDDALVDWQDLMVSNFQSNSKLHFGSRIAFDEDGHLFFSHGERGSRHDAQSLSNHAGTILRLNLDGSVPADNPYIENKKAFPQIWSYGHRNPQGLAYDANNKRLWAIEHGPRGGDEINLILPAHNYGWPVISYGKEYVSRRKVGEGTHKTGMEQPEKVYVPSIGPSSLMLYSGKAFNHWQGNLFSGALKLMHLNRVEIDGDGKITAEHRLLQDQSERIRNIIEDHQGWIYIATDSGRILQMKPASVVY